mmetsp:Transcript_88198/g.156367  ORF Transcript_88198/g.156367 Transcript_88198/m.156367 type:complete len:158 (+) Transcript_88198:83-556(+)
MSIAQGKAPQGAAGPEGADKPKPGHSGPIAQDNAIVLGVKAIGEDAKAEKDYQANREIVVGRALEDKSNAPSRCSWKRIAACCLGTVILLGAGITIPLLALRGNSDRNGGKPGGENGSSGGSRQGGGEGGNQGGNGGGGGRRRGNGGSDGRRRNSGH